MKMNEEKMKALKSLKTAKGQIEGIMKMLEDGRYFTDISNQIIAAQALLKKANMLILKQHINHLQRERLPKQLKNLWDWHQRLQPLLKKAEKK
jgi:CsoR family transcriptional regulator, copper-sensing transcriptional repressor